jgi:hypothetical protein
MRPAFLIPLICLLSACTKSPSPAESPDLILHHANIITVDPRFTVAQAISVKDGRILAVGTNSQILKTRSGATNVIDLGGKTILPGLIDSHVHPAAAMTEFDHPLPDMNSIADVLAYVRSRAEVVPKGQWIVLRQVFITRLAERRYPTRLELDAAAPDHPVLFSTGPDASVNSLALKLSNIDASFKPPDGGAGQVELDPATGQPTGILRNLTRFVKATSSAKDPTEEDHYKRTIELFRDYNSVGITTIADRSASPQSLARFQRIRDSKALTVRVAASMNIETIGPLEKIQSRIADLAKHPLRRPDPMLQLIGIKTFLDGGMLTGSAYMRQPWGVSEIYSIKDPAYRGLLFIPRERLLPIVRTCIENNLQFTAHSVGDGAVHTLLDVYSEIDRAQPIRTTRPCITHCNFMSDEAIAEMKRLGVVADIQPAWLYLDAATLEKQFGYDRLRYFQPLKSMFEAGVVAGGGSDHMQKIGSFRSINPYNPFLGMQTTLTRHAKNLDRPLHGEEALSRQQAIRFYTINNAYLLFREQELGSLEPGKRADLIVIDRDLLTCRAEDVSSTRVLMTYLDGRKVFESVNQ